ncbi:hypothetical protein JCM6882_003725 [Rhodosporidiobolus microsporus]
MPSHRASPRWTSLEEAQLRAAVGAVGTKDWDLVRRAMPKGSTRTVGAVSAKWRTLMAQEEEQEGDADAPWTEKEDKFLLDTLDDSHSNGNGRIDWSRLTKKLGGGRTKAAAQKRLEELKRERKRKVKEEEDEHKLAAAKAAVAGATPTPSSQNPPPSTARHSPRKVQRATYTVSRSFSPLTEISDSAPPSDEDIVGPKNERKEEKGKGRASSGDPGPSTVAARKRKAEEAFEELQKQLAQVAAACLDALGGEGEDA